MVIPALRSIRAKLAMLVALAVLVATLIAAWSSAVRESDRRRQARLAELQGIGAVLANTLAPTVSRSDRYGALASIRAMARIPRIKQLTVTLPSGDTLADLGSAVLVMRGDQKTLDPSLLVVEAPIQNSGTRIGTLRIVADQSDLDQAFNESIAAALAAGLLAALAGLAVALQLQALITRPIRDLMQAMNDVRNTNAFDRVVPQTSRDETGALVASFNEMLAHIRQRDNLLARHRDRLEADVAERTVQLNQARLAAERANAAKSDFLATMSHEIRTPMTGLLVMAELLSTSPLSPRLQRYADVILRSGRGLIAIINDILDFSKIEAGKLEIEHIPLDPAMLADDTARLFAERAAAKGLELVVDVAAGVPHEVIGDPVRIGQIIANLTNNALKFTATGSVVIRLAVKSGAAPALVIEVADTGIGIAPEKLATIFDAFTQAEQSTARQYGGTGIGLAICRRLALAMGGTIEVESEPGRGTTFRVFVPLATATPLHTEPAEPTAGTAARIVLIALEDGPARAVLARRISEAGFKASVCDTEGLAGHLGADLYAIILRSNAFAEVEPRLQASTAHPILCAVSAFGDGSGALLVERGRASTSISTPLTSADMTELIGHLKSPHTTITTAAPDVGMFAVAGPNRLAGRHVLAADDTAVNREILIEALGQLGLTVSCVENGVQAVEAVKRGGYDLVLMDGSMPEMDGFEATRAIRAWEAAEGRPALPVVALTAHVIGPEAQAWREAGMNDCVTKPFTIATLARTLERWIAAAPVAPAASLAPGASQPAAPSADAADIPSGAGQPDDAILDRSVIDEIRQLQGPGGDLLDRVVGLYRSHAPAALDRLCDALASGHAKDITSTAHALRSVCRNIGAVSLGNLCAAAETAARAGDVATARTLEPALRPALAATLEALAYLDEPEPGVARRA